MFHLGSKREDTIVVDVSVGAVSVSMEVYTGSAVSLKQQQVNICMPRSDRYSCD